ELRATPGLALEHAWRLASTSGPVPKPRGYMDRSNHPAPSLRPVDGSGSSATPSAMGEEFSRTLLDAMIAFRDGDFTARLSPGLTGIDGKVADTFNEILAINERRARETARVSHAVGKAGELKL